MDKNLIEAVKEQIGGDEDELEGTLTDVMNHGADSGWPGFTYYHDTVEFFLNNKKEIIELAKEMADDLGENVIEMIGGFNCLKYYDYKTNKWIEPEGQDAIGKTIYGRKNDTDEMVANALAWFALEEVARYLYDK